MPDGSLLGPDLDHYASGPERHAYPVGTRVRVLNACSLPREVVIGSGVVERITPRADGRIQTLYWVSGFACARTSLVLRLES